MARKEITTPLDLKNLENHNDNYDELYSLVDETDRRISEDMWEEIKDANTMKMLEPVQTAADLPSEAADKSLITVIDEQRVYGFVNGEWQPFSEIDLDPFEPFKDELAEIVAAYEKQIQIITTEVQNTKTSAIDSIQSTQTQSEASITQTKQSAIDSINQTQAEAESQISTIRAEMTTQASDLTALFNDHMAQLTSKQDTALAEVESAKQAAITAIEDFNNTDTSNWQKYKLTESNGDRIRVSDIDPVELGTGFYQIWNTYNMPETADGSSAYWNVDVFSAQETKQIRATLSGKNRVFQKNIHKGEDLGWKELTGVTRTVLFEGSAKSTGALINLNTSYENFTELRVKLNRTGGNEIFNYDAESGVGISINYSNVYGDNSEGKLYEMTLDKKSPTELEITSQRSLTFSGTASDDSGITILKIWGVT
ncbi:hypothetical protein D0420_05360 [Staphylococcus saprophyticus]|uniref:hypothetical protein n=1 Tax=Staphylococcus saprophyticus TaxID=29385 RepID=UPI001932A36B|nr:hypothetical protein [Staphylococcus saprophyticus]MBM0844767.1 hypothetical protein [Staphylococcus saprophyticus]MDW4411622.1 hypothetical protein [Staphylococcus saprophyticus]